MTDNETETEISTTPPTIDHSLTTGMVMSAVELEIKYDLQRAHPRTDDHLDLNLTRSMNADPDENGKKYGRRPLLLASSNPSEIGGGGNSVLSQVCGRKAKGDE
ncbi:hypothetical protein I302_109092 [Kwoniella bestiolae CBS 10118]|uniref:Uncharacterized protein n=1 Tax=Kwoniella bestiolae CBS 10118 TaxID=1296100 RepID=A0A1B9FUY6_9TREE|nr:hypothetical protein I302_08237 [Kwoniella bestiolae CBS 10118]OCF22587.1 hypothetical protein I302_08237 [Kwoniella bestiolae CBS 10118]